jgi:transaldolase/glucose-6-phosphate isomerase
VMGGDVEAVLDGAVHAMHACAGPVQIAENPGAKLGAILGALARAGRNKLTFVIPPPLDSLGLWIEQLVAESTGKEGKGIVPVAGEPLGSTEVYGDDRVFVHIRTEDASHDDTEQKLTVLEKAAHPVLRHVLRTPKDLGEEFFLWEVATAVAGYFLGIDPFDQPNVQESKDNTKRLLGEYQQRGTLTEQPEIVREGEIRVLTDERNKKELHGKSLDEVVDSHLSRVKDGDYVAITQYFAEQPEYDSLLQELRTAIRDNFRVATTTGYGPRFLHSTGQLHKGGADNGVFIQLTAADTQDIELPGENFTFGVLAKAQALGDFESLSSRNRRAIRVDLGRDIKAGLERLLAATRKAAQQRTAVTTR